MQSHSKDVIVNLSTGFSSVEETLNHLNAPPLRADKAERLMEYGILAQRKETIRLTIPNSRTNLCIMSIDPVIKYLLSQGFLVDNMNFEESEAFHSTVRSANHAKDSYGDMTSGSFTHYDLNTNLPNAIVTISYKAHNRQPYYSMKLVGESEKVMEVRDFILTNFTMKKPIQASIKIASVNPSGSLEYTENNDLEKNPQIAVHAFYPWMKVDLREENVEDMLTNYLKEFLESKARVLILIGPPGTGKSTLIRTLITQFKVKATLAYTSAAVEHPSFIKDFVASLESDREDNEVEEDSMQPSVLVMEDSDTSIRARENGNKLMAEFLNTADGIASSDRVKMVFSTNLPNTRDIDVALMRPGRCFDVLPFRLLTASEAAEARRAINLPEKEFDDNVQYSLAEALNDPSRHGTPEIIRPRFGFAS